MTLFILGTLSESVVGKGPKGAEGKTKPLLVTNPFVP